MYTVMLKCKNQQRKVLFEKYQTRLSNHLFSLAELNHCIPTLVTELNERPFKKLPGNRREAFGRLDKTVLRPLPVQPWR